MNLENTAVGAYINLNPDEFWENLAKQEQAKKIDVVLKFGDETKHFTKEELAKLLF